MKPLQDILVIDFSQYLSGPAATLKLADLGARVIKIEQPNGGDPCRDLLMSMVSLNGTSSMFSAINRNKESVIADLKNEGEKTRIMQLIRKADVLIQNFRPGVAERLGIDYERVKAINPGIVYGTISGYGAEGPWAKRPGQDLLVQAVSGVTWLNGNSDKGPVPLGIAVADLMAGGHLVQGILAGLVQRGVSGEGCKVSVNMLESMLDLQFEAITLFHNDGGQPVQRTASNNAQPFLGAPYGVYETANGYMALAMGSVTKLGELIGCQTLTEYTDPASWFIERDLLKKALADHLKTNTTEHWLSILEPADFWCADVMDWDRLFAHDGFKVLEMIQQVTTSDGFSYLTTRCPIKFDGENLTSTIGFPKIGEHTEKIYHEFLS